LLSASLLANIVFAQCASSDTKEFDQQDTGDESPDVSEVRDPTRRGRDAADPADKLKHKPNPD
jgi:hypothetical protein